MSGKHDTDHPKSDAPSAFTATIRTAQLPSRKPYRFDLKPDSALRATLAQDLGLLALNAFRFKGEIKADGGRDFVLTAELDAAIVQACVISLEPVPGLVSETVMRRFIEGWTPPEGEEVEMPEDDTIDPLPEVLDLLAIATEALVLALPLYPRAEGVELGAVDHAPPGAEPIREADLKPFASLAALKQKLEGGDQ